MMAGVTVVVLSSAVDFPGDWAHLGQWMGSISISGGASWSYAHVLHVQNSEPLPVSEPSSQRLNPAQRCRLFNAVWKCTSDGQVHADLHLLFNAPVIVEDPRHVAQLRRRAAELSGVATLIRRNVRGLDSMARDLEKTERDASSAIGAPNEVVTAGFAQARQWLGQVQGSLADAASCCDDTPEEDVP